MTLELNPYAGLMLASGGAVLVVGGALAGRPQPAVRWLAVVAVLSALWAVGYGFELASGKLPSMLFWARVEYVAISYLPVAWIRFVARHTGEAGWARPWLWWGACGLATMTLVSVWTSDHHTFHYRSVGVDAEGHMPLLTHQPGIGYFAQVLFVYGVFGAGLAALIRRFRGGDAELRRREAAILVGAAVPLAGNLLYQLGFRPEGHIDLTPMAFLASSVIVGFALVRYRLFEVVPLGRQQAIEAMRDGMLVLDRQGRVADTNPVLREIALVESGGSGAVEAWLAGMPALKEVAVAGGGARLELAVPGVGGGRYLEVSVTPMVTPREGRVGTLLMFHDISERRAAAVQLEAQAKELRELSQLKSQILSIIAHDLRSPLAGLSGLLQTLESNAMDTRDFRELLPVVSRNVGDATLLLDNLLRWSKSQLEGERLRFVRFDLRDTLDANLGLVRARASEKGIHIDDHVSRGAMVWADPDSISLVLRNLLGNAVKFCGSGDRITIDVTPVQDDVTLCIGDTGTGMSEETLKALFGPNLESRLGTRGERGTGIGLKLCRYFVEANGGRIWAESEAGRGSRFFVRLKTRESGGAGAPPPGEGASRPVPVG